MAIFLSSYLVGGKIFTESVALGLQTAAVSAAICMSPVAGFLSDRFGRKPIAMISLAGMLLGAYPLYRVVNSGNNTAALGAMVIFMIFVALGGPPIKFGSPRFFPEASGPRDLEFPTTSRREF